MIAEAQAISFGINRGNDIVTGILKYIRRKKKIKKFKHAIKQGNTTVLSKFLEHKYGNQALMLCHTVSVTKNSQKHTHDHANNFSMFHWAMQGGAEKDTDNIHAVLQVLLSKIEPTNLPALLNTQDTNLNTPLHIAMAYAPLDAIIYICNFLQNSVFLYLFQLINSNGLTPIDLLYNLNRPIEILDYILSLHTPEQKICFLMKLDHLGEHLILKAHLSDRKDLLDIYINNLREEDKILLLESKVNYQNKLTPLLDILPPDCYLLELLSEAKKNKLQKFLLSDNYNPRIFKLYAINMTPRELLETDDDGQNILHRTILAKGLDLDTKIEQIKEYVQGKEPYIVSQAIYGRDKSINTVFHLAIRYNSHTLIDFILTLLNDEQKKSIFKVINKEGKWSFPIAIQHSCLDLLTHWLRPLHDHPTQLYINYYHIVNIIQIGLYYIVYIC